MATFKNKDTNEIVRVMSEDENFYILDSGQKMDKKLFVQKYVSDDVEPAPIVDMNESAIQQPQVQQTQPSDTMNADDFFAAKPVISGTEKLKTVNTTNMVDLPQRGQGWTPDNIKDRSDGNSGSAIQPNQAGTLSVEQQKQILIENYNAQHKGNPEQQIIGNQQIDINDDAAIDSMMNQMKPVVKPRTLNENGLTEAQEQMRQQQMELSDVDPYKDKITAYRAKMGYNPAPVAEPKIIQQPSQTQNTQQLQAVTEENEVIKMFKKFKRNYDINIKFSLKDKIGKPEFIQMMADGLDGDIIQFYTDELFTKFISDFDIIKEDIYNQIYKKVYDHDKPIEIDEIDDVTNIFLGTTNKTPIIETLKSGDEVILIPGGKTKAGKQKYKFINNKNKLIEMLIESAQKKEYRPATKKDLKK